MPHKRQKKSVRDAESVARGYDNAPTASDNFDSPAPKTSSKSNSSSKLKLSGKAQEDYGGMSKTVYRILNAERIRKEMKERDTDRKKRKAEQESAGEADKQVDGKLAIQAAAKGLKIMPGENLKAFNNRVEQAMRTDISSAIKASKSSRKKAKLSRAQQARAAAEAEEAALYKPPPRKTTDGKLKERASDFSDREKVKLNDIAMEPPTLKLGKNKGKEISQKNLPVSMKQKAEMEAQREEAIARYRELKARQVAAKE